MADNDAILNETDEPEPVFDDDLTPEQSTRDAPADCLAAALTETLDHFSARGDKGIAPQNMVVTHATANYLRHIDPTNAPTPGQVEENLLAIVNGVSKMENRKTKVATEKLPTLRTLTYWQVAQVLLALHHVVRIAPNTDDTDREYDLLAMYVAEGPTRGTHTTSEDDIRTVARQYNAQLSLKEFTEVLAVLREDSPRVHLARHRDLVPVANGVFFYGQDQTLEIGGKQFEFTAKSLHPFDPALVFLAKSHVAYVEDAQPVFITDPVDGTVWDVESWIEDLFHTEGDDEFNQKNEGLADLVWEILGAIIRPYVPFGKTAWFYSEQGNNGKGTLCALMRNLVGSGSHTSIPLADFGKEFALEPLVRATAIIVDENDVGTFIDKAANVKAVVTGDVIQINRKYRMPMAFQFHGFMVQCLNEFPRMKDKSESNYRRQLFVPFTKSFTGAERKYIKDDYLQRQDVLEYVLKRVLMMDYYELSEPPATKAVLAEYKETNDPVRAFWQEFRERLVWDLLPFTFLYDLYKAWYADVSPSGSPVAYKAFVNDLVALVRSDEQWHCPDKNKAVRSGTRMVASEPVIAEYDLKRWLNPHYTGHDPMRKSLPALQANYRGLQRLAAAPPTTSTLATTADDPAA